MNADAEGLYSPHSELNTAILGHQLKDLILLNEASKPGY